jgi:peptidoglycan/xylan/chitin deacetylase (PgdA/CDA1 family)
MLAMMRRLAFADAQTGPIAAAWLRALVGALSPGGARGRLTILIFHRVHPRPDELFPNDMHAQSFRELMLWVRDGFNVLPLEEAAVMLGRGALPARALAITFDDGYADNATIAVPILRELGLHATFFVATGFLDGGRMFNDTIIEVVRRAQGTVFDLSAAGFGRHAIASTEQRREAIETIVTQLKYLPQRERRERVDAIAAQSSALPDDLMMTRTQLRSLASAGCGIGGHTMTHPILARIDEETARREIAQGRDALVDIIRQPVKLFAYPNGKPGVDYTALHVRMVRDLGFAAAVSTRPGAARTGESLHELPRFAPWGRTRSRFGMRMAANLLNAGTVTG